ncbi:MAG: methyltransferase domain-containing protein [Elainella sp. Prado103]|jgi:prolyl-tRNA editing enzyme YbaK/EbsC (Cys-tRNA(Pro) deacylase)/SAM-dependent methyltransferase|nr:methyltransferase domain-containing protein [Elainella sp. Prado103]
MATKLSVPHIVTTIAAKFEAEGLTQKFFKLRPFSTIDGSGLLDLSDQNCLVLEFVTPYEDFPNVYRAPAYRMLVIFSLYKEQQFAPTLQNTLSRLSYRDNIDRIILWSTVEIDHDILQLLKDRKVDVIFVEIPSKDEILKTRSINHFIPIEGSDLTYSMMVNVIAERLIKRLRKLFHLVLSEIAAPIYEQSYGRSKIATHEFMEYESEKLNRLVKKLKHQSQNGIAIDVGCGTGRHSFTLARHFENVYAYDFSPNMIEEANRLRQIQQLFNVIFLVNDFEYEKLMDERQFYGQCDLVVASFGMGSFVEDTNSMLRRFYDWLKPGGYIFLSFYNANSITLNVTPNWRDSALSAQIDRDSSSLEVTLTPKTRFNVFCKLFDEGVEGEINRIFTIDAVTTYPMIMALLPNNLLENEFAHASFVSADKTLAEHREGRNGYYTIVIAHKDAQSTTGHQNVMRILQEFSAEYEVLEHEPVLSMPDVRQAVPSLSEVPKCLLKTILIAHRDQEAYVAIVLPSEKRLDMQQVADLLQVNRYHIHFAREKEILQIGFPLGGIAPFGFEPTIPMQCFIDTAIVSHRCKWLYMGIGDNRKTLKIRKQDFLRITAEYRRIDF